MITQRRYWWTNNRERLVLDGDPEAAFLAFAPGAQIGDLYAERLGLLAPPRAAPVPPPAPVQPAAGTDTTGAAKGRSQPKGTDGR